METPRLDRALVVAVPLSAFSQLLWFALPGFGLDFAWGAAVWLVLGSCALAYAALTWRLGRSTFHIFPRALALGVAAGACLFTAAHLLNRFGDRGAAVTEWVEVTKVTRPFGRYSGYMEFRRPGRAEVVALETGAFAVTGRPLSVTFHAGLFGWAWVDELTPLPRRGEGRGEGQ